MTAREIGKARSNVKTRQFIGSPLFVGLILASITGFGGFCLTVAKDYSHRNRIQEVYNSWATQKINYFDEYTKESRQKINDIQMNMATKKDLEQMEQNIKDLINAKTEKR